MDVVIYLLIGFFGVFILLIPALFEIRHKLSPSEEKKRKNRVTTEAKKGKLNSYGKSLLVCTVISYGLSVVQFNNDNVAKNKMSKQIDSLNTNSKKIYEALTKHNLALDSNFKIIPIKTTNILGNGMQLNNNVISDNVYGVVQNQLDPRVLDSLEKEIQRQQKMKTTNKK